MFWADKIASEIIQSGKYKPYWVDDMFTPSGFPHLGSLRGPLIHDMVHRAFNSVGQDVTFTYVFNDFDTIDGLPEDLQEKFTPYMGFPLRNAPSPVEGFSSFAEYFTEDMKKVLESLGVKATYLSSWDLYHEGKFNDAIRKALDGAEKILNIYAEVAGSKKRELGWLPLQVICEQCGRLGTTRVHDWDGKTVAYTCEPNLVKWAEGCGNQGRISPFDGNGKLPWKVDWPAHWSVLGVTIEGAGKDHSSAGSSRDIARELCKEVFNYPEPYNLPYEFFLIGGKKMSSSKGLGIKARDFDQLLPASVARFLFTRTDYRQTIEFEPVGTQAIPDLYDEYDRCWQAYYNDSDEQLSAAFVYAQIDKVPEKQEVFLPRFRDVANYLQLPNIDLETKFAEVKGGNLTGEELTVLKEREKYAKIWLETYAPGELQHQMSPVLPEAARDLTEKQKEYLGKAIDLLESEDDPEQLQVKLYGLSKEVGIPANEAFGAIYLSMAGHTHGPKAAWFLLQYPKDKVIQRLKEATDKK